MPATFDRELSDPVSRMRHTVGDFNTDDPLRDDSTYEAYLLLWGVNLSATTQSVGELKATRDMLRALAAEFAQDPTSVRLPDGTSVTWADRIKTWVSLADLIDERITKEAERRFGLRIPIIGTFSA